MLWLLAAGGDVWHVPVACAEEGAVEEGRFGRGLAAKRPVGRGGMGSTWDVCEHARGARAGEGDAGRHKSVRVCCVREKREESAREKVTVVHHAASALGDVSYEVPWGE